MTEHQRKRRGKVLVLKGKRIVYSPDLGNVNLKIVDFTQLTLKDIACIYSNTFSPCDLFNLLIKVPSTA